MERTMVIIKPDAVNRSLIGEMIGRFERKCLKVVGMKLVHLEPYVLKEHYSHHKDKEFYEELIEFMSSIPSVVMVLEGKDSVKVVRKMVGATNGREASAGTIRGDYSISNQANLVHASESIEAAKKEIGSFFKTEELYEYRKMNFEWIYTTKERE